jgi:phosphatidylserine/phosphatidylglycerophosphate/cardiolipin synthase-like enzyme
VAQIPAVLEALAEAKAQGVTVHLIFESPEHFEAAARTSTRRTRSSTGRALGRPAHALLHAKAVIVDGRDILVTDANLAHQASLELGLLCRGGGIGLRSVCRAPW